MPYSNFRVIGAVAAAYILLVLIFPVRKMKQPVLPWLICTASQIGSFMCLYRIRERFTTVPAIRAFGPRGITTAAIAAIIIGNILLIALINLIAVWHQKKRAVKRELANKILKPEKRIQADANAERLQKEIAAAAIQINSQRNTQKSTKKLRKYER